MVLLNGNLGIQSGHFARKIRNGASCQDAPKYLLSQVAEDEQPGEQAENRAPEEPEEDKAPEGDKAPEQEDNKEAARKGSFSMEPALLPEELEVVNKVKWGSKAAGNGKPFLVFRYKQPWGPDKKFKQSE